MLLFVLTAFGYCELASTLNVLTLRVIQFAGPAWIACLFGVVPMFAS